MYYNHNNTYTIYIKIYLSNSNILLNDFIVTTIEPYNSMAVIIPSHNQGEIPLYLRYFKKFAHKLGSSILLLYLNIKLAKLPPIAVCINNDNEAPIKIPHYLYLIKKGNINLMH